MSNIEQSIDLDVSAAEAYRRWRRFEDFPQFMEGVESVQSVGDNALKWKAEVGGKVEEWDATITEDIPAKRIAWAADSGAHNAGVVTFHYLDDNKSRMMLQLEYDPQSVTEKAGNAVGVMAHRVKGDLDNFKKMVENGSEWTRSRRKS